MTLNNQNGTVVTHSLMVTSLNIVANTLTIIDGATPNTNIDNNTTKPSNNEDNTITEFFIIVNLRVNCFIDGITKLEGMAMYCGIKNKR